MTLIGDSANTRADLSTTDRLRSLVLEDRVHRNVYVDESIFALEMTWVFGQSWMYVCHESQIPAPNDFVSTRMGLRPVIVSRDKKGELHVLMNRCTHRAATVCRVESGNAASFQCPYHGWTFRNDGTLTGVPWPDGYAPDFSKSDWGLAHARVESYRGFVFATLNPDSPSLTEHLGPAASYLSHWIDRSPGNDIVLKSGANRMVYEGNWKLAYDNSADGYHPAFSHRSLLKMAGREGESKDMVYFGGSPDEGAMTVRDLGNGHTLLDQRPTYFAEGGNAPVPGSFWAQQRVAPGRERLEAEIRESYGDDADRLLDLTVGAQMNLNIFPNLLIIGNQVQVIEPLAVNRTQLTWWSTTLSNMPAEINAMRMRHQEDFPSFGEPDDQANFEEAQRGLAIPEVEWVLFNRGYGIPGRQTLDSDGVQTAPVTDELPMRAYYAEWLRRMEAAP
ncbi:MAG: Rieske 2Fe-2S domain-containing protein [Actinomycetes bacterium]